LLRVLIGEQGKKLTEVINERHENPRYFPGIDLPENLVACPDIEEVVKDADVIIFCVPHQFMRDVVSTLEGKVRYPYDYVHEHIFKFAHKIE
jgi:glycerol-3-phosphate dehydrogenase (NAD+)